MIRRGWWEMFTAELFWSSWGVSSSLHVFFKPKVSCSVEHVWQTCLSGFPLVHRFYVFLYFHLCFYGFVVVSPGFQAAATKLSLGASIGLWLDFKSRWGLVNPSGPLCCRNAPRRTNRSAAGAVAPPSVALLGSGNQNYESVRGRQRTTVMRLDHIWAKASWMLPVTQTKAVSFPVSCDPHLCRVNIRMLAAPSAPFWWPLSPFPSFPEFFYSFRHLDFQLLSLQKSPVVWLCV